MIVEAEDKDFAALLAGAAPRGLATPDEPLESQAVLEMLRALANTIRPDFAPAAWLIVEDGEAVGLCSLVSPPADGVIKIGYGVASSRRGRGAATRGVAAVLAWAKADPRVVKVEAETSVNNPLSQGILTRNGFQAVGARRDPEDGELICWAAATKA